MYNSKNIVSPWKRQKLTAPGIPKPSPIQVLTGPNVAWLARSNGMAYFQRGMVVSECGGGRSVDIFASEYKNCRFYSDFTLRFSDFNSFYIDISFLSNLHPRLTFAGGSPVLCRWQGRFILRRPLCIRFNYPSLRYLIDLTQCKLWLR